MKFFVEANKNYTEEIRYVAQTISHINKTPIEFIANPSDPEIKFNLSQSFWQDVKSGKFNHEHHLKSDCIVRDEDGNPDYLSTIFYMINSLQEYNDSDMDEIGRFRYDNSYQKKFGNIEVNLVNKYFQKAFGNVRERKSLIFLSHDIDSVNGALLQDSLYLLRKGNPLPVFKIVLNAALSRPDWLNMDKIMKIEDEHSLKSTFFWLVNKGRLNKREVNSDYDINGREIRRNIDMIESKGWENGLHKSISADTYKDELGKIVTPVIANRNHYLKFRLPDLYNNIEASGLQMDASLGFAEAVGFRNSFGLPFHPFNIKERRPYRFLEVPLMVMDGTLKQYLEVPLDQTAPQIISFLEKNKSNSLISILWHNTFFSDFKFGGYLKVYRQLLEYIRSNDMQSINPQQINKEFAWNK